MGAGALILNQPGVYLVDVDGNAITVTDGLAIGSAEALIIAGKDGANARFVRVESDGTVRIDPTGTTTQPISASSLPLPAGAATSFLQTQPGVDIGDVTVNNAAGGAAVNIQDGGNSITVDATSLPLPTGAATEATLATRASEATLATLATEASQVAQSIVDNAGFTDGTTRIIPAGFIFDETAGTAFVENDAGAARIDDKRAQILVVEDFSVRGRRLVITATNAAKVDGSAVTQPISAVSLPLPAGAATEVTLATRASEATLALIETNTDNLNVALSTRLAEATFTARINTLGQKTMAASTPVVLSSDQTVIPVSDNGGSLTVDTPQLPAALVGGRLDVNQGAWLGSTAPTVGQKAMASSVPVVISSDQSDVGVKQATAANLNAQVVGPGASGAAISGNPVRVSASDGTNTRDVLSDTSGRLQMVGAAADGTAASGNPVQVGGVDGSGVAQRLEMRNADPLGTEQAALVRSFVVAFPTFSAVYDRIAPAANKYMATLFNTSSTRKVVVQRIYQFNWQFTGVTDNLLEQEIRYITARTAGTTVTPFAHDSTDTLSSGITADHLSTAVTDSTLLKRIITGSAEAAIAGGESGLKIMRTVDMLAIVYERKDGIRGWTLRENQGLTIKNITSVTVGTCSYVFEFTDEPV